MNGYHNSYHLIFIEDFLSPEQKQPSSSECCPWLRGYHPSRWRQKGLHSPKQTHRRSIAFCCKYWRKNSDDYFLNYLIFTNWFTWRYLFARHFIEGYKTKGRCIQMHPPLPDPCLKRYFKSLTLNMKKYRRQKYFCKVLDLLMLLAFLLDHLYLDILNYYRV